MTIKKQRKKRVDFGDHELGEAINKAKDTDEVRWLLRDKDGNMALESTINNRIFYLMEWYERNNKPRYSDFSKVYYAKQLHTVCYTEEGVFIPNKAITNAGYKNGDRLSLIISDNNITVAVEVLKIIEVTDDIKFSAGRSKDTIRTTTPEKLVELVKYYHILSRHDLAKKLCMSVSEMERWRSDILKEDPSLKRQLTKHVHCKETVKEAVALLNQRK